IAIFATGNSFIYAQDSVVTGTVMAEDMNGPLPGATVQVKGTNTGAVTDFDGNFSLNISTPNPVLLISYVGYVTQEVNIAGKKTVTVVLKPTLESLDEV